MADDDTTNTVDMTQDDATQKARSTPTESSSEVDVDLVDDETKEKREKFETDEERTRDDIEHPELKKAVQDAEEAAAEQDEKDEQRVKVDEGESPIEAIENEGRDSETTTETADADDGGVMDGVADDDIEEAMDMELNVRDDVDPEHFNYEDQDFSVFGGYGQQVTVEYNDTLFLLEQPDDRKQEELINNMGGGIDDGGMQLTEMMESMITASVARPHDIDEITSDWTPFERMGLGLQCMEFLGIDSLGNM